MARVLQHTLSTIDGAFPAIEVTAAGVICHSFMVSIVATKFFQSDPNHFDADLIFN